MLNLGVVANSGISSLFHLTCTFTFDFMENQTKLNNISLYSIFTILSLLFFNTYVSPWLLNSFILISLISIIFSYHYAIFFSSHSTLYLIFCSCFTQVIYSGILLRSAVPFIMFFPLFLLVNHFQSYGLMILQCDFS